MTYAVSELPQNDVPPPAATAPHAANGREGDAVPDAQMLRRYVRAGDEAAFAVLVRRHSRLVIGVCRRVLRSEHDIEDAFQATFLVLARDAARIRKSESLASWLHGVAYRTSLRACDSSRRRGRLLRDVTMSGDAITPSTDDGPFARVEERDQQQALDEELTQLPDKYRSPLILHYLDGKSNQQVAHDLGLTVTAVEGRLKRGKKELRLRLARRGIGLSVAVALVHALQSSTPAAPSGPLIAKTIDASLSYAGGEPAGAVYTVEAARLAGQEIAKMSTTTAATLAAAVLLPLTLSFAGHDPTPGNVDASFALNTAVAQTEADGQSQDAAAAVGPAPAESQSPDAKPEEILFYEISNFRIRMKDNGEALLLVTDRDGKQQVLRSQIKHRDLNGDALLLDGEVVEFQRADPEMLFDSFAIAKDVPGEHEDSSNLMLNPQGLASSESKIVRFDERTPNAIKIDEELEQPTEIEFVDTPLMDAIAYLSEVHHIPILIDEAALNDVGIPTEEPINLILKDIKLQSAFNLMLRPLGLTTINRDEVLMVTATVQAETILETRVYDLRALNLDADQLLETVVEATVDAKWKIADKEQQGGSVTAIDGTLIVSQTQAAHRQITSLLEQLLRSQLISSASK